VSDPGQRRLLRVSAGLTRVVPDARTLQERSSFDKRRPIRDTLQRNDGLFSCLGMAGKRHEQGNYHAAGGDRAGRGQNELSSGIQPGSVRGK